MKLLEHYSFIHLFLLTVNLLDRREIPTIDDVSSYESLLCVIMPYCLFLVDFDGSSNVRQALVFEPIDFINRQRIT